MRSSFDHLQGRAHHEPALPRARLVLAGVLGRVRGAVLEAYEVDALRRLGADLPEGPEALRGQPRSRGPGREGAPCTLA